MRILHIHDRVVPYGGGEVYLAALRDGLRALGHETPVLYLTPEGTETNLPDGAWCLRKPHGVVSGWRARPRVAAVLEAVRPDVVHLHALFSPVCLANVRRRAPVVLTLHSLHLILPRGDDGFSGMVGAYARVLEAVQRRQITRLDGFIAPSRAFQRAMLDRGFPEARVAVVPHFTDMAASITRADDGRTLVFIGRLSREKGVIEFIDMLARLPGASWRAVIVGDGPLRDEAVARVADLGLRSRVRFTGRLGFDELPPVYREATVVVVPSMVTEAFSLVGIEAMAHGKPVAAFDAGGVREWLADGRTGRLVEQGDVAKLAEVVWSLLQRPDLREQMGREGVRTVEARFRRPAHVERVLQVYRDAIDRRGMVRR